MTDPNTVTTVGFLGVLQFIIDHWVEISAIITFIITSIITVASAIVKLLPTLKQDNPILPTVKVLSKIALNRNKDDSAERATRQ